MAITFLIFIQILYCVSSLQFEDPHQNGVTFYLSGTSLVYAIVDENNNGGRTRIARITDVQGTPKISYDSTAYLLEARLERENSDYVVTVNLLDRDALVASGKLTTFFADVIIGETTTNLVVAINNLDDESPRLEERSCSMEEETKFQAYNYDCALRVYDLDGWLGTMKYTIVESTADIFELEYDGVPSASDQWAYVYIVLKDDQELDYETNKGPYEIQIEAVDAAGHSTIPPRVTVSISVADKRPVWTSFPTTKHIDEESATSFIIAAIDNDTNSNHDVNYSLYDPSGFVTINSETGNITVASIDRDNIVPTVNLAVTAYYTDSPNVSTTNSLYLMIDDIDDNAAIIERKNITVYERSYNFEDSIYVRDIDVGDNSNFTIDLKVPDELSSAIYLYPKTGYGFASIIISGNIEAIKYLNNSKSKSFQIEVKTTGIKTPTNIDMQTITVYLSKGYANSSDLIRPTWMMIIFLIFSLKMMLM